jgi:protein-arginine kinase activator protein McsA
MLELKHLEKQIRKRYNIQATLGEQLQDALANENYEKAATIRDQLKARGQFPGKSLKIIPGHSPSL